MCDSSMHESVIRLEFWYMLSSIETQRHGRRFTIQLKRDIMTCLYAVFERTVNDFVVFTEVKDKFIMEKDNMANNEQNRENGDDSQKLNGQVTAMATTRNKNPPHLVEIPEIC